MLEGLISKRLMDIDVCETAVREHVGKTWVLIGEKND